MAYMLCIVGLGLGLCMPRTDGNGINNLATEHGKVTHACIASSAIPNAIAMILLYPIPVSRV